VATETSVASAGTRPTGFLRRSVVAAAVLFVLCALWGIASPVPSGPDEGAHLTKAAGIAHGTLIGTAVRGEPETTEMRVPATLLSLTAVSRCDYHKRRSAHCAAHLTGAAELVGRPTYVGRYPPLYYAVTGLPFLVSSRPWTLSGARLLSGLLVAVTLGTAFGVAWTWGRSRTGTLAVAVGVPPTALYLGGVVNPSALEVGAAALAWTALAVLVVDRAEDPPPALVAVAAVATLVLAATRPISALIAAAIVASVALARPRRAAQLWTSRSVRVAGVVTAVGTAAAGVYVLVARAYEIEPLRRRVGLEGLERVRAPLTSLGVARTLVGSTQHYLKELVSGFGSPNFAGPWPVEVIGVGLPVALVATLVLVGRRRDALVLVVIVAALGFAVPFVLTYTHYRVDGNAWQGRYSLPMVIGLPFLALTLLADGGARRALELWRRAAPGVLILIVGGQVTAFYWLLRRYTVGLSGRHLDAFAGGPGVWHPFVPAAAVFVLYTVVTVTAGVVVWRSLRVPLAAAVESG
jgi:hypothetical protein